MRCFVGACAVAVVMLAGFETGAVPCDLQPDDIRIAWALNSLAIDCNQQAELTPDDPVETPTWSEQNLPLPYTEPRAPVPLSVSATQTAQAKVKDMHYVLAGYALDVPGEVWLYDTPFNQPARTCNMHSWSDRNQTVPPDYMLTALPRCR